MSVPSDASVVAGSLSSQIRTAHETQLLTMRLTPVALAIQRLGQKDYADSYTGDEISTNGKFVTVYVTNLTESLTHAFRMVARGAKLNFAQSGSSLAQILTIQNQTTAAYSSLMAMGITLDETYPDIAAGRLVVGVVGVTAAQTSTLQSMFGGNNIEVVNDPPNNAVLYSSRYSDSAPWKGGSNITNCAPSGCSTAGDCTSGFGVYRGSTTYLITASHCYPVGWQIYNGFSHNFACDRTDGSGCAAIGTVHQLAGSSTDSELITTPSGSSNLIWAGPGGSPHQVAVNSVSGSAIGSDVCNEGAYSLEECGLQVTNNSMCKTFIGGWYFCNLVTADATSTTAYGIATEEGDSGGPVVTANLTSGVGTVTGGVDSLNCVNNTYYLHTEPSCSSILYYTALSSSLSLLSVNLN